MRYTPGFTASGHTADNGFWHPGAAEGCAKCPGWVVRCDDGAQRHAHPFPTKADAARFAEWGHPCTARHTIERTTS